MTNVNISPKSPLDVLLSCADDVRFQLGQRLFDDIDIFLDDDTNQKGRHDANKLPIAFAAATGVGGGDRHSCSSALEAMKRLFLHIQSIEI